MENTNKNSLNKIIDNKKKNSNNKKWYKDFLDKISDESYSYKNYNIKEDNNYNNNIDSLDIMKINYDLYNNILDHKDIEYVTNPYGKKEGESIDRKLPARIRNHDIISSKIKAVLGIEHNSPFNFRIVAVNKEATTRKEKLYFDKIDDVMWREIKDSMNTYDKYILENGLKEEDMGNNTEDIFKKVFSDNINEKKLKLFEKEIESIKKYMSRRSSRYS